ncbi:SDR family NAD(P)-dependent oxidoreductase [Paucibacter sp. O1-1]|nr:SDR family NAD(P)-dependent oxidoreductase [Paucibacter sp. O1-1]MDA3824668.1 SDR family NAD(P)-dependent oxidoreductase [Paucibacter sp. O1-1]
MKLYIITGASRGMGEAIARQLISPEHLVIGISRRRSASLAAGPGLEQWEQDLAEPLDAAERLQAWLAVQDPARFSHAALINNAGVITPPGPIDAVPLAELSSALRVGLETTLLLSSAFLRATRHWTADKRLLNISSGLGRRAMAGSAPYCAAKAGMDNLSRAIALDEAGREHGARIVSLAPGIIDTEMQSQLRAGDPAAFPDQPRFAAFKTEGQLDSPEAAAAKVLRYLARADFGETVLADVRDA